MSPYRFSKARYRAALKRFQQTTAKLEPSRDGKACKEFHKSFVAPVRRLAPGGKKLIQISLPPSATPFSSTVCESVKSQRCLLAAAIPTARMSCDRQKRVRSMYSAFVMRSAVAFFIVVVV